MLVHFIQEEGVVPRRVGLASENYFVLAFVLVFVPEFVDFKHVAVRGFDLGTCKGLIRSACQVAGVIWSAAFDWGCCQG